MMSRRAPQRAWWGLLLRATPRLLGAALGLGGCGPPSASILIVASISGVPEDARTLRATSYLDGRPEQDPAELPATQRELVVRLQPVTSGRYRLEIDALGDDGCSFAQGQAEAQLGAERRIELPIALGSSGLTSCLLVVRKTGPGQGYVDSDPLGISCGSREGVQVEECLFRFQRGVSVHLSPRPSARASFDGWSDACTGFGQCDVLMTGPRSVSAAFGVKIQ